MPLLLHVCCGPCLLYPARVLEEEGISFTCFFYNHNIHPYKEFKQRLNCFRDLCADRRYNVLIEKDYGLQRFLRSVVFREQQRCRICYRDRLQKTIQRAASCTFTSFSTTLLFSRHQNHNLIVSLAENLSFESSVTFLYRDFRRGWNEGREKANALGLYRQKYCGCIFSERQRWDKSLKKR